MDRFEVGEVAIFISDGNGDPELGCYHNQDVQVTGPLTCYWEGGWAYCVTAQDGQEFFVVPSCLRKKRPPEEDINRTTSWDIVHRDCGWRPKEVVHV